MEATSHLKKKTEYVPRPHPSKIKYAPFYPSRNIQGSPRFAAWGSATILSQVLATFLAGMLKAG